MYKKKQAISRCRLHLFLKFKRIKNVKYREFFTKILLNWNKKQDEVEFY